MSGTDITSLEAMGRWEPDARGRLGRAALELYVERGFEQTTVAEIAARAGLTERTFFRHFADKREVLFAGQDELTGLVVGALAEVPGDVPALDAAVRALEATTTMFRERRAWARVRAAVIDAHPELRERELIKLAGLGSALATGLGERGVAGPAATLAAQAAGAVFRVGFERWVAAEDRDLDEYLREALAELKEVASPREQKSVS